MAYDYLVHQIKEEILRETKKEPISEGLYHQQHKQSAIYQIAVKYEQKFIGLDKRTLFSLCESLLSEGSVEMQQIAVHWLQSLKFDREPVDFVDFQMWAENHIRSKTVCDDYALFVIGDFIVQNPMFLPDIIKWTFSPRWQMRRMAAVTMIYCIRRKRYFRATFETANFLRTDERCEVQEAFRWLLREAYKVCPKSVSNYVEIHASEIPEFLQLEILTADSSHREDLSDAF
ncbi:MAG: DNA alkylation repair protein [Bdellovibrionales bacterium]|nr:DNA alkylation repair protein [Bdellovibrionales bacterium]